MPTWLSILLGVVAGVASAVSILSFVMSRLDERMDEKVETALAEVRKLEARVYNGLLSEIKRQGAQQGELSDKIDHALAGLAEIKGRLDVFLEIWEQRR